MDKGEEITFKISFVLLTTGLFSVILFAFPYISVILLKTISIILFGFAMFKISLLYWKIKNQ
jgi:hypothetical protein